MKGYIFEYYKYVRMKDSMDKIRASLPYPEAEKTMLTFGDYDRLTINVVKEFSRYRDLSALAKRWVGNRQSILLYEMEKVPLIQYDDEYGFFVKKTGGVDDHLFFAVTEFGFQNELHNGQKYEELLENAKEKLEITIRKENPNIDYTIMGTLGSFGIAVLWFCDQFTEILRLVNCIRVENKELFWAALTTISKNLFAVKREDYNSAVEKIKGQAVLQITLKKPIEENLKELEAYKLGSYIHTSGEYDVAMNISAKDAYQYFEKEEIFNHDTDKYQKIFLQTRLTLGEEAMQIGQSGGGKGSNGDGETSPPNNNIDLAQDLKEVYGIYDNIRRLIETKIDKTAGLIDTLDSLLCDYRYNVASAVNERWAADFSYIFRKNLECIEEILIMLDECRIVVLELLSFIMNNLKQQTFHIAEANILNLEIPKCHLRYTGQEDGILFCYMGIIKEILEIAYRLDSNNKQSEIVPLVTVDVVPIIESDLYFDKVEYSEIKNEDQDFKILSLNLPHVSFYDIPSYMQYMYHEIYHYIVPKDRELRDYQIGILLTTIYFYATLSQYLNIAFEKNIDKAEVICDALFPLLYSKIYQEYSQVHKHLTIDESGMKIDKDAILFVAELYKNKLLDYLESVSGRIFLEECFRDIRKNLHNNDSAGISFDDLLKLAGEDEKDKKVINDLFRFEEISRKNIWEELYEQDDLRILLDKTMDGIKEATADVPMIQLAYMPLDEYLLYYSNGLKNNLVKPEDIDLRYETKELTRLGIILDRYEKGGETLENVKESYRKKYTAKYFSIKNENEKTFHEKMEILCGEADRWVDFFLQCRRIYRKQYKIFSHQMKIILDGVDIQKRIPEYDLEQTGMRYFGAYRKAYEEFAKALWNIQEKQNDSSAIKMLYEQAKEAFEKIVFHENIALFQHFQCQRSLTELRDINLKANQIKRKKPEIIIPGPKANKVPHEVKTVRESSFVEACAISSMREFWDVYQKIISEMENNCKRVFGKTYPLWYRGQGNSAYGLLPGIMRSNVNFREKSNYLSQYQRMLFEEFKYRADGAPEIMDRSFFNTSDYLTLMQHYHVSTTLMDWSEDIFTALYFAMEKLLTHQLKKADKDAAVFIFSPHLYNEARRYMMKNEAGGTACTDAPFKASMDTITCFDSGIPNIATNYNEKLYDMFLLGNLKYESYNLYGFSRKMKLEGKDEMAYLPVAVYTSRLNPRIRSQSGIFLAYNLYAEPSSEWKETYKYMELEKIQEYYLRQCSRKKEKVQFLYKIIISKNGSIEIANALSKMGISKERIYPELSNIGERVNYRD